MNKKIKFVMVGFGNMGREWLKILKQDKLVEIVGVVDVIDQSLVDATKILSLSTNAVGKNLQEIISLTKPDAILDTSPPFNHKTVTTTAIEMGCHVLGEKPMSSNIQEAGELIKLSKMKNKIYMLNQNYRWHPMIQVIKKYILRNKLGKINTISINYSQNFNFNFNDTFRYKMDNPLLLDMAIHHFDLVRCITGFKSKNVYCLEYNPSGSRFKNGSSTMAIFEMDNGVFFNYQGSWSNIGHNTSFMGTWKITGEKGTIAWDGIDNPNVELLRSNKIVNKQLKSQIKLNSNQKDIFLNGLKSSLSLFTNSIKNGVLPETWCGDNIYTLSMVLSAIESAEKQIPINIFYPS